MRIFQWIVRIPLRKEIITAVKNFHTFWQNKGGENEDIRDAEIVFINEKRVTNFFERHLFYTKFTKK